MRTATCACGQLSVSCASEPAKISLCYCLDCQKRTGSTYGIAAFFPAMTCNKAANSGHSPVVPIAATMSPSISVQLADPLCSGSPGASLV